MGCPLWEGIPGVHMIDLSSETETLHLKETLETQTLTRRPNTSLAAGLSAAKEQISMPGRHSARTVFYPLRHDWKHPASWTVPLVTAPPGSPGSAGPESGEGAVVSG